MLNIFEEKRKEEDCKQTNYAIKLTSITNISFSSFFALKRQVIM